MVYGTTYYGRWLATSSVNMFSSFSGSAFSLRKEATSSPYTLINTYQTKRCHKPEDDNLNV